MNDIYKTIYVSSAPTLPLPQPFQYKEMIQLGGGHTPIRGVIIDNANSTLPVYVWPGRSPNIGNPQIILPTWSRGFTFSGTSGIYIVINGIILTATIGLVNLTASSTPIQAFSSVATTQNSPPLPPISLV